MRLNLLAPPDADAAALLPRLRGRAEVAVWTEPPPWEELNRADVTIYQLSADPALRAPIAAVCRRHPGLVVLHGDWEEMDDVLGVVVFRREQFEALRRRDRWTVTLTTPADCAEALLELAAAAGRLRAAVAAHALARQAAAALSPWAGADAVGIRAVAQAIHSLTAPSRRALPARRAA